MTISAHGNEFRGVISWLEEPEKRDTKNPDFEQRNNKLLNKVILQGFTFDGKKWGGTTVYDPNSGSTYQGKMWMRDNDRDTLYYSRAMSVFPFFGCSEIWKRTE